MKALISSLIACGFCAPVFAAEPKFYRCEVKSTNENAMGQFVTQHPLVQQYAKSQLDLDTQYLNQVHGHLNISYDGKTVTGTYGETAGPYGGSGEFKPAAKATFSAKQYSGTVTCAPVDYVLYGQNNSTDKNVLMRTDDDNTYEIADVLTSPYGHSLANGKVAFCYYGDLKAVYSALSKLRQTYDDGDSTRKVRALAMDGDRLVITRDETSCTKYGEKTYIDGGEPCIEHSRVTTYKYEVLRCR